MRVAATRTPIDRVKIRGGQWTGAVKPSVDVVATPVERREEDKQNGAPDQQHNCSDLHDRKSHNNNDQLRRAPSIQTTRDAHRSEPSVAASPLKANIARPPAF